jgi:hypothetical protein
MTPDFQGEFEKRLNKLERTNRILWIVIFLVGIMSTCLAIGWATMSSAIGGFVNVSQGGTVTAKEFRLVDQVGHLRAVLAVEQNQDGIPNGLARFSMLDVNQAPRLNISQDGISFADSANVGRAAWGIDKKGGSLWLADEKGRPILDVRRTDRGPRLLLLDQGSPPTISIEIAESGPRIVIVDEKGKTVYSTPKRSE